MYKTLLLFLALACSTLTLAQDYNLSAGARLGYPLSASVKKFFNETTAVEVYGGIRFRSTYRWINISAAYLRHHDISAIEGFRFYYGGGASAYFWSFDNDLIADNNASVTFGIQGYAGLEYTFSNIPLSLSADWVPTFFLNGFNDGFGGGFGSLGIRYVIR